jgi:uncharacterized membrane protein
MMITDPFYILVVFLGIISVALTLISRFEIANKISPVIMILFFAALLANTGILPTDHGFYGHLSGYAVPFAVCQILLHVRFSEIRKTGLPILKAFAIACLGSMAGCLIAGVLLHARLDDVLAGQGWKLTGPYIGTYIGGSINFFSLWSGLDIDSPELFAAANAVDNLTLIPIFMFWVFAPGLLKKWYPETAIGAAAEVKDKNNIPVNLKLNDMAILVFVGLLVMAMSNLIKKQLFTDRLPQIPSILIVTTIALLLAQFKSVKRLQGAKELGNFAFYLFFAAIGAMMDIPKAICLAPILFFYVVIAIVSQIIIVLLIGRALKCDLRMLAVASIAAKAGPSSVVAYTNAKDWNDLALPGVAAGLLGYAAGNYAGLAGAYLLKMIVN